MPTGINWEGHTTEEENENALFHNTCPFDNLLTVTAQHVKCVDPAFLANFDTTKPAECEFARAVDLAQKIEEDPDNGTQAQNVWGSYVREEFL
jgi:hypothetical protein